MSAKNSYKSILLFVVIAIAGSGNSASAHMESGYGYNRGWHQGRGMHHFGNGCQGGGDCWENMSESQIEQMQTERKAFFDATREIRQQIYQKRLELRSELAKKEPDSEKCIRLQKEISALWAQFGLKRLDHILKLKKINPDVGRGLMGSGWGACGMTGPGHHMGPAMMGPGYYMGSGGFGPEDTRQYHGMPGSPSE